VDENTLTDRPRVHSSNTREKNSGWGERKYLMYNQFKEGWTIVGGGFWGRFKKTETQNRIFTGWGKGSEKSNGVHGGEKIEPKLWGERGGGKERQRD